MPVPQYLLSTGGRPKETGIKQEPVISNAPTLTELGVSKKESSEAQLLADLPDETYEEIRAGNKSIPDVRREKKRAEIIERLESVEAKEAKKIEGVYDVIVIDPPCPVNERGLYGL